MFKTEKLGKVDLNDLKIKIRQYLSSVYEKQEMDVFLDISRKKDGTIVTRVDKQISALVDQFFYSADQQKLTSREVQFFCEEAENREVLRFPCLAVDPIDGTKELAAGTEECCVSVAYLDNKALDSESHQAWLYNPFTGFEIHSEETFTMQKIHQKPHYLGLVSRSEFEDGYFLTEKLPQNISVAPRGSIAFKLGLLAAGACDFVVSKRPKNIWDIAAGTVICSKRDIFLYDKTGKVSFWSEEITDCPLIWCHPSLIGSLSPLFHL